MKQLELAVGLIFLLFGVSVAIYGFVAWGLGLYTIAGIPLDQAVTAGGFGLAAIGIIVTVIGLGGQPSNKPAPVMAGTTIGKFCTFCGNHLAPEAVVCPKCGRQFRVRREKGA